MVYNCSALANDLHKIFQSYWVMGHPNSSLPQAWPAKFDTDINKQHPLLVEEGATSSSSVYLAVRDPGVTSFYYRVLLFARTKKLCLLRVSDNEVKVFFYVSYLNHKRGSDVLLVLLRLRLHHRRSALDRGLRTWRRFSPPSQRLRNL